MSPIASRRPENGALCTSVKTFWVSSQNWRSYVVGQNDVSGSFYGTIKCSILSGLMSNLNAAKTFYGYFTSGPFCVSIVHHYCEDPAGKLLFMVISSAMKSNSKWNKPIETCSTPTPMGSNSAPLIWQENYEWLFQVFCWSCKEFSWSDWENFSRVEIAKQHTNLHKTNHGCNTKPGCLRIHSDLYRKLYFWWKPKLPQSERLFYRFPRCVLFWQTSSSLCWANKVEKPASWSVKSGRKLGLSFSLYVVLLGGRSDTRGATKNQILLESLCRKLPGHPPPTAIDKPSF